MQNISDSNAPNGEEAFADTTPYPEVFADIAGSFTYASYQNAIPVIRSLQIENNTDQQFDKCRLELTSSPAFLHRRIWHVDRLFPGDKIALDDRKMELDSRYLAGLNEAERGEITLRLTHENSVLFEKHYPVRLLARDEWGGVSDMAQLLPAFSMPNDPSIAQILRAATEKLDAHGQPSGLDGYQSKSPQRTYLLTAAIYSAITGLGIHYANPPASFELRGQKIRRPVTIVSDRLGTCLDTTLLFTAALEATGLHPVILIFSGHAAAGVWLTERTFTHTIETDQMEVRKALASGELIIFETTGVTQRPPMTMEAARQALKRRISEEEAEFFHLAIDVHRARSAGITPLASHEPLQKDISDDVEAVTDLPLPPPPDFSELSIEIEDLKPTNAAGRIDRWQKKLLDLTLRNRLLNLPNSGKTIPFLCTDAAHLEDRLAAGASVRIISLSEHNPLGERDEALFRDVHGRDIQRSFAADALDRDELSSLLDSKQLEARLIDLYRQVRNDFAEGGANTLFLAVGFLRWKKKPEDQRTYRAPLLLIPVKLERRSATSNFTIRYHEDETRFNATLLQFLERDFDLVLPQFNGALPTDENGVDVPRVLAMMRQAVRDVSGMEVVDETALSTFSFAKFLMWKDLVERTDALRENRVVRHLIDTPDKPFEQSEGSSTFSEESELDRLYKPMDIICLLPSDSSQTAASLAAAEGRDFVIVGPPGTGKSQTIANMIANCLAVGKTVLFVAEKTAALDVVYRRLREHGLGNHCIELHSNKADRRHFLTQLKAAWENGRHTSNSEWVAVNERLRIRRDELNAYVEALHKRYSNGLTPYSALGIALKSEEATSPSLSWSELDAHDEHMFANLEDISKELGHVFLSVERRPSLSLIDVEEWSSAWQERLLFAAQSLHTTLGQLQSSVGDYLSSLNLKPHEKLLHEELHSLALLARALQKSRGRDVTIASEKELTSYLVSLDSLKRSIHLYREAEQALSASYTKSAIDDLDLQMLDREWRNAAASFWPKSFFGKRKIRNLLQSYADEGVSEPAQDIPLLRRMKEHLAEIDQSALNGKPLPIHGVDTDIDLVKDTINFAIEIQDALLLPDRSSDELEQIALAIAPCLRGTIENDVVRRAGDKFLAVLETFKTSEEEFQIISGGKVSLTDQDIDLLSYQKQLDDLLNTKHLLRDWTVWCETRNRAVAYNLLPLVKQIESGEIQPDNSEDAFRLGYVRWWLPKVLDADPVLRNFRRFQHENTIKEFREIDDLVRAQATHRVISALAHGLPPVQGVPRKSELGILRHQMELQRPSQSIRDMIGKMPESFPKLAPCMLMSPLSIAQYLPPNQALFDIVIFDEASQITTWDAVGAIARARQTIIVGDPKQLPPTNFFGRNEDDDGSLADHEKDMESILDEAKASGIPLRDLRWHYRSRSESLIAFSNYHYYQNRLVTFPSPSVEDRAVHLRKIPNGIYDRGKSRTNRIEAEAVVREAVSRMKKWLSLPEKERPTLGVITFNAQQQMLILDLLDAARRDDTDLEWFFSEERVEPTIVKNLENVQGDERDVILFSITFWKDEAGKVKMDFGALNRDGGERRLNVAVTRARQELIVFSGFTADQIDPSRTKALGAHHLKAFLDYAERGAIALPAQDTGSVGGFDSPFEEAVAAHLEKRGWTVIPQVGISGFRIDLGIRHPDLPGTYLAGVECDGATYHASATARDRDKVREQVLRGLGWNILRVWSTDWWFDPSGCAERLHTELQNLLEESRSEHADDETDAVTHWDMGHKVEGIEEIRDDEAAINAAAPPTSSEEIDAEFLPMESHPQAERSQQIRSGPTTPAITGANLYHHTDLSTFEIKPDQFFEFGYRKTLEAMINAVMETESPIRRDILAQRISRAHNWLRTGGRIRERINLHLRDRDVTKESSGEFLWKKGSVSDILPYRHSSNEEERRSIPDIPLAELTSVVLENPGLLEETDPARALARLLGIERLAGPSRSRLEEAFVRAKALSERKMVAEDGFEPPTRGL